MALHRKPIDSFSLTSSNVHFYCSSDGLNSPPFARAVASESRQRIKWVRRIGFPLRRGLETVIWFPHAGGGAAPLIRAAVHRRGVNLFVATLPGREGRFLEPMPETLDELTSILGPLRCLCSKNHRS